MRTRKAWTWAVAAVVLLPVAAFGWDIGGTIETWDTSPWEPYDIVVADDGTVWATHHDEASATWPEGVLIQIDPSTGTVTTHEVPDAWGASGFWSLARTPGGTLWISDSEERIVSFDPGTETFTEYPLPAGTFTLPADPFMIQVADDGVVWFSCYESDAIGSYDPGSGTWTEYPVVSGVDNARPADIAFTDDGTVWFTTNDGTVEGLGSLDPTTGTITLRQLTDAVDPFGIITDGGDVWFLDHHYWVDPIIGALVRYDIAGDTFETFPVTEQLDDPHMLVMDPDGVIWLTAFAEPAIGTFDPATSTFEDRALAGGLGPMCITLVPDGEVWWANADGNVGRIIAQEPVEGGIPVMTPVGVGAFGLAVAVAALWLIRRRGAAA